MGFQENSRLNFPYKYDSLVGKWTRQVKSNRTFNLSNQVAVGSTVVRGLVSGSVGGNREILLTNLFLSSSDSDGVFEITAGTSTLWHLIVPSDNHFSLQGSVDSPLAAVSGTTVITVDIGASAAASSSISVSLSGVVFPKAEALETK